MKKRIVQSLLLLGMMVFLSTPLKGDSVAPKGVEEDVIDDETEIIEMTEDVEVEKPVASVSKRERIVCTPIENHYEYFNQKVITTAEKANEEMAQLDFIEDRQEWFVKYKEIIEKYSDVLDPPESIYDYHSDEELDLLFRVVQAEIGDEYSFEQKCNVCSVIFNRLNSDKDVFKKQDSLSKVLISSQFSTISNGRYRRVEVSEKTILACEYVFMIENTMPDALFFDSDGSLSYKWITSDGAHNFYGLRGE